MRREEATERSVSFAENVDKDTLVRTVKTNIIESGAQRREPFSNDNYHVTVDPSKEQMKITKRGQATIAMKRPIPKAHGVLENLNNRVGEDVDEEFAY